MSETVIYAHHPYVNLHMNSFCLICQILWHLHQEAFSTLVIEFTLTFKWNDVIADIRNHMEIAAYVFPMPNLLWLHESYVLLFSDKACYLLHKYDDIGTNKTLIYVMFLASLPSLNRKRNWNINERILCMYK